MKDLVKENEELKEQINWLKKFVWEDSVNLKYDIKKAVPPFRVGRKQKRAILDSNGHEVGVFITGQESIAQVFCDFLNANYGIKPSGEEYEQQNTWR